MKIVLKTDVVKKLFSEISSCIVQDKINAIHNMYIKNNDGCLYVRAMDGRHVFQNTVEVVQFCQFAEAYIPFFELNKFVSKFKNEQTIFTFKQNDVLRVSSGKSYCQVSLKNAEQSESVSNMLNSAFSNETIISKKILGNIKNKMIGLVASDNNRPVLNGVCFDMFEGKLFVATSDGKKLGVYDTQIGVSQSKKIVVPTESINSVCSVCDSDQVKFVFNDKYVKFSFGQKNYYSTLVNGEYPDYRRILNSTNSNNIIVQVNKNMLSNALSFVNVNFEVSKKCELKISQGMFSLNFNNNQSYEQFEVTSEADFSVFINSQFLEKMVKPLQEEVIKFKFLNSDSPILIQADSIQMMLMPLRVR